MTTKAYGIGYSGRSVEEIYRLALQLDAVVFDVRYSPRSRNWQFSGKNLRETLGDRYRHVKSFGNKNYKGGPVALVDFEDGLDQVLASDKPVILMCVCGDPERCHRAEVGRLLQTNGVSFTELGKPGAIIDSSGHIISQGRLL